MRTEFTEYNTFKEVEDGFPGDWTVTRYRDFMEYFKEWTKKVDEITISPDIATIICIAEDIDLNVSEAESNERLAFRWNGKRVYI